jgi:hypothetical protein
MGVFTPTYHYQRVGKHAARTAYGQTDDRRTSGADTSRSPPQESDTPQPREEGSGTSQPSNTQLPEACRPCTVQFKMWCCVEDRQGPDPYIIPDRNNVVV